MSFQTICWLFLPTIQNSWNSEPAFLKLLEKHLELSNNGRSNELCLVARPFPTSPFATEIFNENAENVILKLNQFYSVGISTRTAHSNIQEKEIIITQFVEQNNREGFHWYRHASHTSESIDQLRGNVFIWRNRHIWNNDIRLAPSVEYPWTPFPVSSIGYHPDHNNATKWPIVRADNFRGSSSILSKSRSAL